MRRGVCKRVRGFIGSAERLTGIDLPGGSKVAPRRDIRDFGQAVVGAWDMPARVPILEMREHLVCPTGMVLGTDELCYPKGVLSSRNLHRKWRRPPRATVTAGDAKAIRTAAAARDRVLKLAKDVGLHASKSKPAPRAKAQHQHLLAAPARQIRVISEETN